MIKRLFAQVVETISATQTVTAEDREAALRLATAVLMVDVARADYVFDESEFDRVLKLIEVHFGLSPEQAAGKAPWSCLPAAVGSPRAPPLASQQHTALT